MSASEHDERAPIAPGSPLARALDDFAVPALPAGFADKVLAAAEIRSAPLPPLRRSGGGSLGWRLGRRIAIGMVGFGALATAAAATGLLERFDVPVPSPQKVWASITGKPVETVPATAAAPVVHPPDPAPTEMAPVRIEGPIDTPQELAEAFRRIDEVRRGRMEARRQLLDERIAREKARRLAAGLPVPDAEEEARLRARIEETRTRREGLVEERIEARREALRTRIENGEALSREDIVRPLREDARALDRRARLERLRQMTPEQRREALRRLPPEQRRELMEAWRRQREERLGGEAGPDAAVPADPADSSLPGTIAPDPVPEPAETPRP
jgi:hypothetical protein